MRDDTQGLNSVPMFEISKSWFLQNSQNTRSSADAVNGLDAFSSQSRSTNMVFWVHCDFSLSM